MIQPDGRFRVMGLHPGKTYAFSVISDQIERTLPSEKLITIGTPTDAEPNVDVVDLGFASI